MSAARKYRNQPDGTTGQPKHFASIDAHVKRSAQWRPGWGAGVTRGKSLFSLFSGAGFLVTGMLPLAVQTVAWLAIGVALGAARTAPRAR